MVTLSEILGLNRDTSPLLRLQSKRTFALVRCLVFKACKEDFGSRLTEVKMLGEFLCRIGRCVRLLRASLSWPSAAICETIESPFCRESGDFLRTLKFAECWLTTVAGFGKRREMLGNG